MKFVRDLFTESDGTTWDLGRLIGTLAFLQYLGYGLNAYVIRGQIFDAAACATGLTLMMAGYGGMILMKGKEATPAEKKP